MSTSLEELGIDRLSVRERLDLIDRIWDSLPDEASPDEVRPEDVPEWHRVELARRRAEADANPGVGTPWREVLDQLGGGT